ncbi:MAG TPA: PilZ domain-containing protein [Candidatus Eisenbacteria bacterium]|jgi:c-di-GMP-binding flagellar brake protein YcgR|nr:PilZ domain-containing protein [Candidatus Eisenbacteria bacterium]
MKTPKSILDRRRSIRISESLPFRIGHKGYEVEAVTVNIAQHGILCMVEKEIKMMTQLDVVLKLPAGRTSKQVKAKGVVVRKDFDALSGKCLVAIYFSDMKDKDREVLREFIEGRLKK